MATSKPTRLTDTMDLLGMSGPSWAPWKVVAKVLEGRPFDPAERPLFEQCCGRTRPPSEMHIIKGRRGGGSRFGGADAVHMAGFVDYGGRLAPGERAVVGLAASDREQSRVLFSYAAEPFKTAEWLRPLVRHRRLLDALQALVTRSHRWGLELSTGVTLEVRTASFGSIRGRSYAAVIADEVAFWQQEDGSNPASEVLAAVRPGLVTLAWQRSTPHRAIGTASASRGG